MEIESLDHETYRQQKGLVVRFDEFIENDDRSPSGVRIEKWYYCFLFVRITVTIPCPGSPLRDEV